MNNLVYVNNYNLIVNNMTDVNSSNLIIDCRFTSVGSDNVQDIVVISFIQNFKEYIDRFRGNCATEFFCFHMILNKYRVFLLYKFLKKDQNQKVLSFIEFKSNSGIK